MAKRSREDSPPAGATDTLSPSSLSSDPGAPFISAASNEIRSSKYLQVTDEPAGASVAMKCSLAPHPETITFNTFEDFEVHYAQNHSNRCSECHKNFPTEHFLGLHISENHDPLVAARKAREEKTVSRAYCCAICADRLHSIDALSKVVTKSARHHRNEGCIYKPNIPFPSNTTSTSSTMV